jgi:predicted RNA-binding protein
MWGHNLLIISTINSISLVICLQIFVFSEYDYFDSNAYGQTFMTNVSDLSYQTSNSSFNAEGTVNTILFLQDTSYSTKPIVKDINTNSSSKYLLGGKWRIDVLKDNLTYFKSNFTMIEVDGRGIHFHTIVYKPVSNESVDHNIKDRLGILFKNKSDNSSGFKCNVDIYTNGVLEWQDVPMTVALVNEKVIMMDIDDKKSLEHFLKNPIYGLINSIDLIQQ